MNNHCYFALNVAFMKSLLLIFLGGGTGSVLRYLLTISIYRQGTTNFPWGTFAVNILGCILIGVFYTLTSRIHINNDIRLMLTIGLCGGFTTFSTFSNESLQLLKSGLYPSFSPTSSVVWYWVSSE